MASSTQSAQEGKGLDLVPVKGLARITGRIQAYVRQWAVPASVVVIGFDGAVVKYNLVT